MESVSRFIEKKLRLKVNREKSAVGRPWERKYLGFCLTNSRKNPKIRIHWKTIKRFKQRVREITARGRGRSLSQVINELNQFMSGWWNYYGLTELINRARDTFTGELNEFIENVRKSHEQIIDDINLDEIKYAGWDKQARVKAQDTIEDFKTFMEANKDEIMANARRLALMNMFLHNIGEITGESAISPNDSLIADTGDRYDYVLTNPPFGKKSSITITNGKGKQEKENLRYNRQDFWATTSNKQLNFVQHVRTMLKTTGQAGVVVPDNVLFEGGAGETVRRKLLQNTDLHTILRLPTGIFYAQGVKANVIFFENKSASKYPWTKEVWFYDFRTNIHFTKKKNQMTYDDLKDFITCYKPENRHKRKETWSEDNPDGRWRKFSYEDIMARDKTSLDIFWVRDESLADLDNLPDPDVLAEEIIENLEAGVESFKQIMDSINGQ